MADENNEEYNDRLSEAQSDTALPKPQIEIIVDGTSVFKPGMKTLFVDDYDEDDTDYNVTIVGTYCSCDTVATYAYSICSCNPVCTCENNCSCDGYSVSTCSSNSSSGTTVSCGSPCACVPVH